MVICGGMFKRVQALDFVGSLFFKLIYLICGQVVEANCQWAQRNQKILCAMSNLLRGTLNLWSVWSSAMSRTMGPQVVNWIVKADVLVKLVTSNLPGGPVCGRPLHDWTLHGIGAWTSRGLCIRHTDLSHQWTMRIWHRGVFSVPVNQSPSEYSVVVIAHNPYTLMCDNDWWPFGFNILRFFNPSKKLHHFASLSTSVGQQSIKPQASTACSASR